MYALFLANFLTLKASVINSIARASAIGAVAYSNANFGQGSSDIWLDNLRCNGTEMSILNCNHNGIGIFGTNCGHYYDVGVECPDGKCVCFRNLTTNISTSFINSRYT